ncbi:MAG: hypothetical protein LBJ67_15025 [Planctomycetaceae bacterium]|nr:hypothetical protein [Planctomycetaceae bacterium]
MTLCTPVMIGVCVMGIQQGEGFAVVMGVLMTIFCVGLGMLSWYQVCCVPTKKFYENGLELIRGQNKRIIMYNQIRSFIWTAMTNNAYGAADGVVTGVKVNQYQFVIFPQEEVGGGKIDLHFQHWLGIENYETVRDKITESIASRMERELETKKEVNWITDVLLTDKAVIYQPVGKPKKVMNFDEVTNVKTDLNRLTYPVLIIEGSQTIEIKLASENFIPGWYLFLKLTRREL